MATKNYRERSSARAVTSLFYKISTTAFIVLCSTSGAGAGQDKKVSPNIEAIVKDRGWLNTSRPLNGSDLQGRIVLLDFWTYCCINCIHVMPDLKELEDEFKDKLTVIGVHSAKFANEKDEDNIRNAILRYGLSHPVVNDASFSIWNAFHVQAWPTFVLIDPAGKIVFSAGGEGQKEKLRRAIQGLINVNSGAQTVVTAPLPITLERNKSVPSELQFPAKLVYIADRKDGPALAISDSSNHRLVLTNLDGEITLSVGARGESGNRDGSFSEARFNKPQGLAADQDYLYVADTGNHTIRRVDFKNNKVTTIAGTGVQGDSQAVSNAPALKTALNSPWDLALSADKNKLFIAMAGDHQIWIYDLRAGAVTTVAGDGRENIRDGVYPLNSLAQTSGLSLLGDTLFFVDAETSSLRELVKNKVTTLIGTGLFDFGAEDGKQGVARLQHPLGLAAMEHEILIADAYNQAVRQYDFKSQELTTVAGGNGHGRRDGTFKTAQFNEPNDIAVIKGTSDLGNTAYVTDTNNGLIRKLDFSMGMVTTLNVHEKGKAFVPELAAQLPNTVSHKTVTFGSGQTIKIKVALDKDWHINDLAPSQLVLFDVTKKPVFVKSFEREALKGLELSLPPLAPGRKYRVQGVFYYCKTRAGSACLVQSDDLIFVISKNGAMASATGTTTTSTIKFELKTSVNRQEGE